VKLTFGLKNWDYQLFRQARSLWSSSCHPCMSFIFLGSPWCFALCRLYIESKYSVRVLWGIWSPTSPFFCCFLVTLWICCFYFSGCRSSGIAIICVEPWCLGSSQCKAFDHLFCIRAWGLRIPCRVEAQVTRARARLYGSPKLVYI
jgi:hypothetical protein